MNIQTEKYEINVIISIKCIIRDITNYDIYKIYHNDSPNNIILVEKNK